MDGTATATVTAPNLAGVPAAILSAEMRPVELVIRNLCSESRVNFRDMTTRDMNKLPSHAAKLAVAPDYGELAKRWNKALKAALNLNRQIKGPDEGSWNPVGEYSHDWGRAGQTACACLCLLRADN